jgi:pentatricopeptide repeat protein
MSNVRIIQDLGQKGHVQEALGHLRRSVTGHDKDVFLYGAAMKVCGDAGQVNLAVNLLAEMKRCGVQPSLVCYNTVITACVNNDQAHKALDIVRELISQGTQLDEYTCSTALKAFAQCKQWKEALEFLEAMPTSYGVMPNVYCYTATINALEKGSQWQLAIAMLQTMQQRGVQPTTITCTSVVSACKASARWQEALDVLKYMGRLYIRPDAHTFSNAISACVRAGKWEEALTTFHSMRSRKVRPTVVCFGAVLGACEMGGLLEESLAILLQMRQAKLAPDLVCYNSILGTCDKCSSPGTAREIFEELCRNVSPDKWSFKNFINVCVNCGEVEAAASAYDHARRKNIEIEGRLLEALLIKCLCLEQCFAWALEVLEGMENKGTKMRNFCNQAGSACAKMGHSHQALLMWMKAENWQSAMRAADEISDEELQGEWYNKMLLRCGERGLWKEALNIVDVMIAKEVPLTCEALDKAAEACLSASHSHEHDFLRNLAHLTQGLMTPQQPILACA